MAEVLVGRSDMKVLSEHKLIWEISEYEMQHQAADGYLISPDYIIHMGTENESKWHLHLYPKAKECKGACESVSISLLSSKKPQIVANVLFSLLNYSDMQFTTKTMCKFSKTNCHRFRSRYPFDKRYLVKGTLVVCCSLSILTDIVNTPHTENPNSMLVPKSQVLEFRLIKDIYQRFLNQQFTDITLNVQGEEIQAHKIVLAASSDVFAAMFEHEMKEKQSNRIEIEDIKPDVIKMMLQFIYTGSLDNMKDKAQYLLEVADRYALEGLKAMCEEALTSGLSINNAVEILILSHLHSTPQLKMKTIQFINKNALEITKTEDWSNLRKNYPEVMDEVYIAGVCGKKSP